MTKRAPVHPGEILQNELEVASRKGARIIEREVSRRASG